MSIRHFLDRYSSWLGFLQWSIWWGCQGRGNCGKSQCSADSKKSSGAADRIWIFWPGSGKTAAYRRLLRWWLELLLGWLWQHSHRIFSSWWPVQATNSDIGCCPTTNVPLSYLWWAVRCSLQGFLCLEFVTGGGSATAVNFVWHCFSSSFPSWPWP